MCVCRAGKGSTLSCQLNYFCNTIQAGEPVLIPVQGCRSYTSCKVVGEYTYDDNSKLPHKRQISIITTNIKRENFPQHVQYSLGAFRTIFKIGDEDEVLKYIFKYFPSVKTEVKK